MRRREGGERRFGIIKIRVGFLCIGSYFRFLIEDVLYQIKIYFIKIQL
jgi:hypothetical protein